MSSSNNPNIDNLDEVSPQAGYFGYLATDVPPVSMDLLHPEIQEHLENIPTQFVHGLGLHWVCQQSGCQVWECSLDMSNEIPLAGHGLLHALSYNPRMKLRFIDLTVGTECTIDTVFLQNLLFTLSLVLRNRSVVPTVHFQGGNDKQDLLLFVLEHHDIRRVLTKLVADLFLWKAMKMETDEDKEKAARLQSYEALWVLVSDLNDDNTAALLSLAREVMEAVIANIGQDPKDDFAMLIRAFYDKIQDGTLPISVYQSLPQQPEDATMPLVAAKDPAQVAALQQCCLAVLDTHLVHYEWQMADTEFEAIVRANKRTLDGREPSILDGTLRCVYSEGGKKREWLNQNPDQYYLALKFFANDWNEENHFEQIEGKDPLNNPNHLVEVVCTRMRVFDRGTLQEFVEKEGWARLIDAGLVGLAGPVCTTPKAVLRAKAAQLATTVKTQRTKIKKKDAELKEKDAANAELKQNLFVTQESQKNLKVQLDEEKARGVAEKARADKKDEQHQKTTVEVATGVAKSVAEPLVGMFKTEQVANREYQLKLLKTARAPQAEGPPFVAPVPAAAPSPVPIVEPEPVFAPPIAPDALARAAKKQVTLVGRIGTTKYKAEFQGERFDCGMTSGGKPCGYCLNGKTLCSRCINK